MILSSRIKIVLMFLLFATPFAASYFAYFFWTPSATANYGTLLRPVVALSQEVMHADDAGDVTPALLAAGLRGKWLIVTPQSRGCMTACTQKLHVMRQMRLLLGKERNRVARVVLLTDGEGPPEPMRREYAGTVWVNARHSSWPLKLPMPSEQDASARTNDYFFAVDPMGNVFMRYAGDADVKRMAADFKRVLKAAEAVRNFEK